MSLTALLFISAFLTFSVLAFVRHPIWGLHAYLLTFYMGPDTAWWADSVPNLRWSLTSALLTLIAVMTRKQPDGRPPWYKSRSIQLFMVLVAWIWVQTPWALSPENHVFLATLFTKYVLMFALVYACMDSAERVQEFALAHILGCFWWGFQAWQYTGGGRLENIGTGDVAGSAFASMHVSTALAFAGFMFMSYAGVKRWLPFIAIPFILNAIILMQTRAAFLGLLAAVPVAFLLGPPSKRTLVLIYLVLGAGLLVYVSDDAFWERMGTIKVDQGEQRDVSAESRIDLAYANLRMARDYPLGVGHRGNDLLSPRYVSREYLTNKDGQSIRSAHNTELAILVDHGWLGLLIFLCFHISIARSILRLRKRLWEQQDMRLLVLAAALATCLVIYWVNGQFANMAKAEVVIWIAAVTAAMQSFPASAYATAPSSPPLETRHGGWVVSRRKIGGRWHYFRKRQPTVQATRRE